MYIHPHNETAKQQHAVRVYTSSSCSWSIQYQMQEEGRVHNLLRARTDTTDDTTRTAECTHDTQQHHHIQYLKNHYD